MNDTNNIIIVIILLPDVFETTSEYFVNIEIIYDLFMIPY